MVAVEVWCVDAVGLEVGEEVIECEVCEAELVAVLADEEPLPLLLLVFDVVEVAADEVVGVFV